MRIDSRLEKDITVVEVEGTIDERTSGDFAERLSELVDSGQNLLVIDLAGVEHFDSHGVRALLQLRRRVRVKEGALVLYQVPPKVASAIKFAGLRKLKVVDSRGAALLEVRRAAQMQRTGAYRLEIDSSPRASRDADRTQADPAAGAEVGAADETGDLDDRERAVLEAFRRLQPPAFRDDS